MALKIKEKKVCFDEILIYSTYITRKLELQGSFSG